MCFQMQRILLLLFLLNGWNTITGLSEVSPHIIKKTHVISDDADQEPIVLDCDYDAENYQSSLLVKWLKDGKPIYQWIKGHKPSVYSSSKGLIDEEFEISPNPNYKHRAIRFPAPTKEISGNYTCLVTTNRTQSIQIHLQIVDVSQSNFELSYVTLANETLVTCEVENVYPQPILLVTSEDEDITLSKPSEKYDPEYNGFFNASSVVTANGFDGNDGITCTLSFPQIEYNITKTLTSSASTIQISVACFIILLVMLVNTA